MVYLYIVSMYYSTLKCVCVCGISVSVCVVCSVCRGIQRPEKNMTCFPLSFSQLLHEAGLLMEPEAHHFV